MSLIILFAIIKRKNYLKEQFIITIFRFLGTLSATSYYGIYQNNIIILIIGLSIALIDIATMFTHYFLSKNLKNNEV